MKETSSVSGDPVFDRRALQVATTGRAGDGWSGQEEDKDQNKVLHCLCVCVCVCVFFKKPPFFPRRLFLSFVAHPNSKKLGTTWRG